MCNKHQIRVVMFMSIFMEYIKTPLKNVTIVCIACLLKTILFPINHIFKFQSPCFVLRIFKSAKNSEHQNLTNIHILFLSKHAQNSEHQNLKNLSATYFRFKQACKKQ